MRQAAWTYRGVLAGWQQGAHCRVWILMIRRGRCMARVIGPLCAHVLPNPVSTHPLGPGRGEAARVRPQPGGAPAHAPGRNPQPPHRRHPRPRPAVRARGGLRKNGGLGGAHWPGRGASARIATLQGREQGTQAGTNQTSDARRTLSCAPALCWLPPWGSVFPLPGHAFPLLLKTCPHAMHPARAPRRSVRWATA
jgi:hypothetical protein